MPHPYNIIYLLCAHEDLGKLRIGIQNDGLLVTLEAGLQGIQRQGKLVKVLLILRSTNRWIMLDPTTDGYFMDETGEPLSLLEMRRRFANDLGVTFVPSGTRKKDYFRLREKYPRSNAYICKNLFYFLVDGDCGFGEPKERLIVCPEHYDVRENQIQNIKYRLNHLPEQYAELIPAMRDRLENLLRSESAEYCDVSCMISSPTESK